MLLNSTTTPQFPSILRVADVAERVGGATNSSFVHVPLKVKLSTPQSNLLFTLGQLIGLVTFFLDQVLKLKWMPHGANQRIPQMV